ncbi:MAG: PilZ domain-containing protein [Bdellovibrionaceae bacterium]|nr:PilZ domain-containing protein [Pseudobdellovibrionaceae bacterium]
MSEDMGDEKRKYRRVSVQSLGATLSGLEVQVVGGGKVELYDVGYGGAAFSHPEGTTLAPGETVAVDFFLNGAKSQTINGRIVRLTDAMFAVEFIDPSKDTKLFVDKLITSRMVGLNMNLIDPQYYRGKETFAYWFHGPKGTNLFLWEDDGKLQKASLDLPDLAVHWTDGMFQIDNKMSRAGQEKIQGAAFGEGALRLAAEILSQMRSNVSSLEEFKQQVFDKVMKK